MMYKYSFECKQEPWLRPMVNGNDFMLPGLIADFRDSIHYGLLAEIKRLKRDDRIPLSGVDVAVAVLLECEEDLMLPMVVKNVLDTLQQSIIDDDYRVKRVKARKLFGSSNRIKVALYILNDYDDALSVEQLVESGFVCIDVETIATDDFLSIPVDPKVKMLDHPDNEVHQRLIRGLAEYQQLPVVHSGDIDFKLEVITTSKEADIDNIALNYISAFREWHYNDIRQITHLQLKLNRSVRNQSIVEIKCL